MWLKIISGGLVIILVYRFCIYYAKKANLRKQGNKLSGPTTLPIIGNGLDIVKNYADLVNLFRKCHKKWPKKYRLWIVDYLYIMVTNAADVQTLLSSYDHIDKSFEYEHLQPWLGTGLLTSNGKKWRNRRKLLTPSFHFKILEDFIDVFNEQSEILIKKLSQEIGNNSFDIYPYITRCALDIICDSVMGQHVNAQEDHESPYIKATERMKDIIHTRQWSMWLWPDFLFNLFPIGKEHAKCLRILHDFSESVIQERKKKWLNKRKKPNQQSEWGIKKRLAFLDLLLEASDNGKYLTDCDIREEVDTFMFEGHDTTAAAVSWAVYLVGTNPSVQNKIHDELDSVIGTCNRQISSEELKEMKYLDCVIKESLRLFPTVPIISRDMKKDLQLDDYTIPAGATAVVLTLMLHRDPTVFPDPEIFDPDRFLPENSIGRHPFAYVPFSAGPRNCIGQKFALMEVKIMLAQIFRSYNIKSLDAPDQIKVVAALTTSSKNGIKVKLTQRA